MNFSRKLRTFKKWSVRGSFIILGTAMYQGNQARQEYFMSERLLPPSGPISGTIKLRENIHGKLKSMTEKIKNQKDLIVNELNQEEAKLKKRVEESMNDLRLKAAEARINLSKKLSIQSLSDTTMKSRQKKKKIKLLLIGDSLACGVGCENAVNSSPRYQR